MKITAGLFGTTLVLLACTAAAADTGYSTAQPRAQENRAPPQAAPPINDPALTAKPPLQTGEVGRVNTETGEFNPNAGAGFSGRSTPVGVAGDDQDKKDKGEAKDRGTGGTRGAPSTGATAPRKPLDSGSAGAGRSDRGAGIPGGGNDGTMRSGREPNSGGR